MKNSIIQYSEKIWFISIALVLSIIFLPQSLGAVSNTVADGVLKPYYLIESLTGKVDQNGNYLLSWNISGNVSSLWVSDYLIEYKKRTDTVFIPLDHPVVSFSVNKGVTYLDKRNFDWVTDFRIAPIFAESIGEYSSVVTLNFRATPRPLPPDPIPELPFNPLTMKLVMQTGFAGTTTVNTTKIAQTEKITWADTTLPKPNDWVLDFESDPSIGTNIIQYEWGTPNQRSAKIITEPGTTDNKVLEFWIGEPNVLNNSGAPLKWRVQNTMLGNTNVKEAYEKVRLYIDPSFATLKNYSVPVTWFTLSEWWNNAGWTGEPYPFRMSVNIVKPGTASWSPLNLSVHGQTLDLKTDKYTTIWESKNTTFDVPLGKWITLEYYVKEWDKTNGRFYLAVTPDGGTRVVVLDVKNFTYHPSDPAPNGIAHIHTMKMYTGKWLIDYMKSQGKSLRLYWDDFQFSILK